MMRINEESQVTGGMALERRLLSPEQLAEYLGVPVKSVYKWNHEGTGPTVRRVGRHVRYLVRDVDAWLDDSATRQPA
jgi:excisionase family DNA binding protein